MKNIITDLLLIFTISTFAQTGIGTTTPNTNAQLEVASATKGFLPPRMALTSTTSASPLAAHVAGMVVYNTATTSDVVPGLYVDSGTAWVKQIGAININGLYDGKNDNSSIFLGGTGFNDDGANKNTSVGINALYGDTSGTDNVGVGYQASPHTSTGSNNTVIGSYANFLNFGSDNAILGSHAGYQTNGSGNVLLGNHAGYLSSSQTFNNKLYIENSSSATPLIYGDFSTNLLRANGNFEVSGTVKIEGGTPGVGKVLTSDANGLASWATPVSAPSTTDNLTEGVTNLYYTEARVSANSDVAANKAAIAAATNANTASKIVKRDASGNFAAGTITAALTGNASSATKLVTARTINSVSFDGTSNITVEPYVEADNSSNAYRFITFGDATTGYNRLNTDLNLYYNPYSNYLYTNISGSLSGNASSATKLLTARAINNISFDGTSNITVEPYVEADNYTSAYRYITFSDATTGYNRLNTDVSLVYNPSSNILYTNISGTLNGNASTATTATNATNVYITPNNTDSANPHLVFADIYNSTGNQGLKTASTIYVNPNAGYVYANRFIGDVTGNIVGTATGSLSLTGGTLSGGLTINGTGPLYSLNYNYLAGSTTTIGYGTATTSYSLYASGRIAATEFNAFSDKRIKTDIKPIENSLKIIKKLRPSSYTKIDKFTYGNGLHYGFIAQELEQVIPEAVTKGKGEVPVLKKFDDVTLEEGFTYTLLVKNGDKETHQEYNTTQPRPTGNIFVLYKKVNDFRTVDYNMVFTYAVAAIKEQQQLIEAVQKENSTLKEALENQSTAINKLKKMVEELVKK